MQTNNKIVMDAIKSGLQSFYELARMQVYRGSWYRKLRRANQLQVGRAIFMLRNVAENPDAYFSRAATQDVWLDMVRTYAKTHGVAEGWARFIVPSPVAPVRDGIDAAFWENDRMRARLETFCEEVSDWYYKVTATDAKSQSLAVDTARRVVEMSKVINDDFIIARDGYAVLYINKFFDNPTLRRVILGERQQTR